MNVQDAAYMTGHDYPGGADALGVRMGMSNKILSNKLNPNNSTHHLTLAEAMKVMVITGDMRILHSMAAELHCTVQPLPDVAIVGDPVLALTNTISEFGEYIKAAADSMADGRITKLELKRIDRELGDVIASASAMQALLIGKEQSHG